MAAAVCDLHPNAVAFDPSDNRLLARTRTRRTWRSHRVLHQRSGPLQLGRLRSRHSFLFHYGVGFGRGADRRPGFTDGPTETIRSMIFGSSGSKPDFGKRGVSVTQLESIANTLRNSGNESSTRPMFTSATACQ